MEGNTDVIALRQAGFEPVVASMGTALTERQLRELGRLTKRLFLCFDADAAGQEATLRGMELAVRRRVRRPGRHPPEGRGSGGRARVLRGTARLGGELSRHYRVRIDLERAGDRQEAFVRARRSSARSRTRPSVRRRSGSSPTGSTCRARRLRASRLPAHGDRRRSRAYDASAARGGPPRERDLLAAVVRNSSLREDLAALTPEHFDDQLHRRFREVLVAGRAGGRGARRAARRARRARRPR